MISLVGLSKEELQEFLAATLQLPAFRARQIWHWLYNRGATDFDQMTTISKEVRAALAQHCTIARPTITVRQQSVDGTRKWLLKFADGKEVETVFIPEEDRGTLCVSSQVGCTLNCTFCHTGTQPWVRNLTSEEIVAQILVARDELGEWPTQPEGRILTNIVLMGMGEPLYNYDNVAKAMNIVMDGEGISLSKRKITLSTSGVVPMIEKCGAELNIGLAVSLHATTNAIRNEIVPLNKKYPIEQLLEACRTYPGVSNARRITFEYVMLQGVNDSDADAYRLIELLKDIPAKVNLIPFNPWPQAPYTCSSNNRIRAFGDIVNAGGFATPVRKPRGQDILAACGQLKSDSERQRKSKIASLLEVS